MTHRNLQYHKTQSNQQNIQVKVTNQNFKQTAAGFIWGIYGASMERILIKDLQSYFYPYPYLFQQYTSYTFFLHLTTHTHIHWGGFCVFQADTGFFTCLREVVCSSKSCNGLSIIGLGAVPEQILEQPFRFHTFLYTNLDIHVS